MPDDAHVTGLLSRWEQLRAQGQEITAEELCQGCPQHLDAVRRQIQALSAMDAFLRDGDSQTTLATHAVAGAVDSADERTADATPATFGAPPATAGRYTVIRPHARGGLGEVFVARDEELNRDIALKRMQDQHAHNPESRRRFLVEAEVTARLEHPGVVPVYGLLEDAHGQPCYAMRFIQGESLHEAIRRFHDRIHEPRGTTKAESQDRFDSLEFRLLLQHFIAVCNTIGYAHSRGIIHRDIKPANVMLGKYGETLVVDWGLARTVERCDQDRHIHPTGTLTPVPAVPAGDSAPTQLGQAVGTPAFMSPEQAAGRWDIIGPPSDIYGLGATLYVLLTGKPPFTDSNLGKLLFKVQQGEFPRPRAICHAAPRALEAIALKALSRRPDDRYATAAELARDVERWLADEPVAAWTESLRIRARRWMRRHRTLVTSFTLGLILLVAASMTELYRWNLSVGEKEQLRYEHLIRLRHTAESQEQYGLSALHANRWADAVRVFQKALESLGHDSESADLRARLQARLERAERLSVYRQYERQLAESIVFDLETDTFQALEEALRQLKVVIASGWWDELPDEDLTPRQKLLLRVDVHSRLLLLGATRARTGFMNFGRPETAREGWKKGLEALAAAKAYERTVTGDGLEFFCRMLLGELEVGARFSPQEPPTNFADHVFLGMAHLWLSQFADDGITQFMVRSFRTPLLDLNTPLVAAERHLRTAVSLYPDYAWTYALLVDALSRADKHAEAELAARGQVALSPEEPIAYRLLAITLLDQAEESPARVRREALRKQALEEADKMMEVGGRRWLDYLMRGSLRLRARANAEAIADLNEAWTLAQRSAPTHPRRYEIQRHLGTLNSRLGRSDLAVEHYTHAIRIYPEGIRLYAAAQAWLHIDRADEYLDRGDASAALADYAEAVRLQPKNAAVCFARAHAFVRLGDLERAIHDARRAVSLNPRGFDLQLFLIRLCEASGKPQEAEQLRAKLPPGPRIHEGLERHAAWPVLWGWPRF